MFGNLNKTIGLAIIVILSSCNMQKYIANHPELMPADTIKITNDVVRYEKEYITNDSIIFENIPCDPIDSIIYKTKTVYKTKYSLKIDTIYQYKGITKLNPINAMLEDQNGKLTSKLDRKNTWIKILSVYSILLTILFLILLRFK